MKAVTFQGIARVETTTVPDPAIRSPEEVIVRNRVSGICGSDLHVYLGRETGIEPGTAMGHEFIGEIVEAGKEVKTLFPGDLVVSPFTTNCGACFYCRKGLTGRCTRGQLFGWVENGRGLEGAQAEYVRVPMADSTLVKLPTDIDIESALFLGDVLATGFFCADMAEAGPDGVYAVVGCGPVGLFAVLGARERGAERIFAIDVVPERLALAAGFGATPVDARKGSPLDVVREATDGRGADGVLEVVGSKEATRRAFDLVRPGGIISAVGVHTEPQLAFSPVEAYDKSLTYRAGRCPARAYVERLLPLVVQKKYDFASIVSHRLPLTAAADGYHLFERKLDGCTKVLLR